MRNDNARWTPAKGLDRPEFQRDGCTLRVIRPKRQILLSGPMNALLNAAGLSQAVGWPEQASGDTYAIRLRRDRVLVINGHEMTDGWDSDRGIAISDVTDGYAIIGLEGTRTLQVLKRGTEIDPSEPSASVVRGFAGYPIMVYAYGSDHSYRIHVPRVYLEGLWERLEEFAYAAAAL